MVSFFGTLCLYTLVPTAIIVALTLAVCSINFAKKENKANPGTISDGSIKIRTIFLIISSILFIVLVIILRRDFIFYIIPESLIVLWTISLFKFLSAKKKIKADPTAIVESSFVAKKNLFIVLSIIIGLLVFIGVAFLTIFLIGIANM